MSQIAKETGIGRATLYKYFPDVEAIMTAWHARQIDAHLALLTDARGRGGSPGQQLAAVLHTYAGISRGHGDDRLSGAHGGDLVRHLHRGEHVTRAEGHLRDFLAELITAAAASGEVRSDVASTELASYCLHALTAASTLPSKAAITRLVGMTLDALRPDLATRPHSTGTR
jgi:AcrR family transcriptional regulator